VKTRTTAEAVEELAALKGHDFSRAATAATPTRALALEGCLSSDSLSLRPFFRVTAALIFCALFLGILARGQQNPPLPPPRPGFAFPQKQTLTYSVDWRVFPAGTAVVRFEAASDTEHVSATADTSGAINLLFHVSDKFQATFDRNTGCTSEFDKQTIEGRRQVNSTLKLDYPQGKSILDEKNLAKNQTKHLETPIPGCLTDLLSGLFYASSQPMEVGKSFQLPVVDALHTVVVTMKAEGKEEIKTPVGTFKTIRVQPTADAGVVKNRGNIWIWYTDDDRHLPVQMRARLFWGTITFRLSANDTK
jgi:hypothetical protein